MRILLAEDEKALSKALVKIFESNNYSIDAVYDGEEALDYFEGGNYDAVILDIMMPKVDGLMVLRLIREIENRRHLSAEQQAKIIMMTAIADMEHVDRAFELGCDAYASKPIEIDKVQEVMEDLGLIS